MSVSDYFDLAMLLLLLFSAVNVYLLIGAVARLREQVGRLTHRVWKLEGSPHCECQDCEVEA